MNRIIEYLSAYITIDDKLKKVIIESSDIRDFRKGSLVFKPGDISDKSYFVVKGCLRKYLVLENGEEKTLEFYEESHPMINLNLEKPTNTDLYLECLEDCTLSVSSTELETEMFRKHSEFESICRSMSEIQVTHIENTYYNFKTTTPEERYLDLLNTRPGLIQRVLQYQLAAYLGIKPESLSRIKKRLNTK